MLPIAEEKEKWYSGKSITIVHVKNRSLAFGSIRWKKMKSFGEWMSESLAKHTYRCFLPAYAVKEQMSWLGEISHGYLAICIKPPYRWEEYNQQS